MQATYSMNVPVWGTIDIWIIIKTFSVILLGRVNWYHNSASTLTYQNKLDHNYFILVLKNTKLGDLESISSHHYVCLWDLGFQLSVHRCSSLVHLCYLVTPEILVTVKSVSTGIRILYIMNPEIGLYCAGSLVEDLLMMERCRLEL